MALTLRNQKGSILSWAELDDNLSFLMGSYGSNVSGSGGWYKFPNGIILQIMRGEVPQGVMTLITLPISFPSECLMVVVSKGAYIDLTGEHSVGAEPNGTGQIRISNSGPSTGIPQGGYFLAIGY